jgi:hypothetical protein
VLRHEVDRIGQGGGQGKGDCHGHVMTSDRAPLRSSTSTSFASMRVGVILGVGRLPSHHA